MPDSLSDTFSKLKKYIEDSPKRELECRKFLEYVPDILCKDTVIKYVYKEEEYRGHCGTSDYVISGVVKGIGDTELIRAYIWEIKAPQCFIFEKDTENRLKPSKDLIEAENQLLHYYHESKGSDNFRRDFQIIHPDNICFGGIIIGCNKTKVNGTFDNQEKKSLLYDKSILMREKYFYRGFDIRLMTWDTVLNHLLSRKFINEEKFQKDKTTIQLQIMDKIYKIEDGNLILVQFKTGT